MPFEKFGLSPELLSGLADLRIDEPTPLQNEVIPQALQERHLLVKNEAGDTGVFLIPAVQKLAAHGEVSETKILILSPSVERLKLIDEAIWAMGYHAQISSASLSMKGRREDQEKTVLAKAPVIVANPGRLIDILEKINLTFDHLDLVVIDDAQDMENHNLVKRVDDIFKKINGSPQILLSAKKENNATKQLSKKLLKDALVFGFDAEAEPQATAQFEAEVQINETEIAEQESNSVNESTESDSSTEKESIPDEKSVTEQEEFNLDMNEVNRKLEQASVKVILNPEQKKEVEKPKEEPKAKNAYEPEPVPADLTQAYIYVPPRAKISTLLAHLEKTLTDRIVVFAASKRTTDRLFRIIKKKGWGVVSIDEYVADSTYQERFEKFVTGEMKILLVGGIPAPKLDLNEVKQVINYDVPSEVEEYKFRAELVGSGKAARMVSLVSKMDKSDMDEIVGKVGYAPTEIPLPEEIKEKKKGRSKSALKEKAKYSKTSGRNSKEKSRKKPKEKSNGLPRPTYDGLSGGREGQGKRPTPHEGDGAFGWIKKLFS